MLVKLMLVKLMLVNLILRMLLVMMCDPKSKNNKEMLFDVASRLTKHHTKHHTRASKLKRGPHQLLSVHESLEVQHVASLSCNVFIMKLQSHTCQVVIISWFHGVMTSTTSGGLVQLRCDTPG